MIKDLDFNKIEMIDFPDEKFGDTKFTKTQITLHHTVSNPKTADGDINYWKNSKGRISTPFIIELDGSIKQCFSSSKWAHHLGVKSQVFKDLNLPSINTKLNHESIGIELDNWGQLIPDGADFKTVYGNKIDRDLGVIFYRDKFRGFHYYQMYSKEQIETLGELLKYLCEKNNIEYTYDEDMWDVNKEALSGKPGVWTHVSYRSDKFDCHPQPELIEMLKSL